MRKDKNVSIIKDVNGERIVKLHSIHFKGKRHVDWEEVRKYLQQYVGEFYEVTDTKDMVYIGSDLPDEYTGSVYTTRLKGALAKAKANATQGIPEMIEIAYSKEYEENRKDKHSRNAKKGWYRYTTKFALPVYDENEMIVRYNIFDAKLLIRHASSGKMYLYDITEIKKETSKSCRA